MRISLWSLVSSSASHHKGTVSALYWLMFTFTIYSFYGLTIHINHSNCVLLLCPIQTHIVPVLLPNVLIVCIHSLLPYAKYQITSNAVCLFSVALIQILVGCCSLIPLNRHHNMNR